MPYFETADVSTALAADMQLADMYGILQLRDEVYNVEQRCTVNDLDYRDLEADTQHYWIDVDGIVVSCLRVLDRTKSTAWVGRICTRAEQRGSGSAGLLLGMAIVDHSDKTLMLHGQSHLAGWYARFGFEVVSDEFDQAGIPHVEMVRSPRPVA